jgi:CrcB protein
MLVIPRLADNFPLDILVANLVASFVLGLVTVLSRRHVVSDGINLMVGTGVAGGLSTSSSFAYGTVVLMSGSAASVAVASAYVLSSLFLGLRRRSLRPTGCETIVPLSRMSDYRVAGSSPTGCKASSKADWQAITAAGTLRYSNEIRVTGRPYKARAGSSWFHESNGYNHGNEFGERMGFHFFHDTPAVFLDGANGNS